jgi:hypothetical protein
MPRIHRLVNLTNGKHQAVPHPVHAQPPAAPLAQIDQQKQIRRRQSYEQH